MSTVEIAGIAVVGLTAVLGLLSLFLQLIVKPVNELTVNVTKLVSALDWVNINHGKLETKVDSLDLRLDNVERQMPRGTVA